LQTVEDKYVEGIKKTGFVLESKVCSILEEHGWNVINNRYYIDDLQEVDREIDIIAYRVQEKQLNDEKNCLFYTTLIISCKKNEENIWAMLTKELKKNDPNIQRYPLSNWSNHKVINFMLKEVDVEKRIENLIPTSDFHKYVFEVPRQVFAFQQLNRVSGKANNDKPIFESIKTSIKALEYEKNSLKTRKKDIVFYDFHILSIFEGGLVELDFDNNEIGVNGIDNIKYLNRHIVNKEEGFYRVHFIDSPHFDNHLTEYDSLHKWNIDFYSGLVEDFFEDITKFGSAGFNLFKEQIEWNITWKANRIQQKKYGPYVSVDFEYKSEDNILIVGLGLEDDMEWDATGELNDNDEFRKFVSNVLKRNFNYHGDFKVDSSLSIGLPF
jgi:hypothetical protein